MKILNLFSGLGGNRRLWPNKHQITAVENDPSIASIYADFYPTDTVAIDDAHAFLLAHHKDYDFIWSSPPCQTHSSFRQNICVRYRNTEPVYPDMRLYQEIIFLRHNCKSLWAVENVRPYYTPLISPSQIIGRHLFWSNFPINQKSFDKILIRGSQIKELSELHKVCLDKYNMPNKRQLLRNCVDAEIGLHILLQAMQ